MNWVKLVLGLVTLLRQFSQYLHDRNLLKQGETKAVAEALAKASEQLTKAQKVREEVVKTHTTNKTDAAFDQEFKRPE